MTLTDAWGGLPGAARPVDGTAKKFAWWRKLFPPIAAAVWLSFVWRWPLAVVIAVMVGLGAVGVVFPLSVPIAVVVVAGLWRWVPWFRARCVRALAESPFVVMWLFWPFVCQLCQFGEIAGRRARVAGLKGFMMTRWGSTARFVIEPCVTHNPEFYKRYADRLQLLFKAKSSAWTTQLDNPNRIIVTLRRQALPREWVYGTDVDAAFMCPPPQDGETVQPDDVYLGLVSDGGSMRWRPDEDGRANLFITGRQGGGKGELARSILGYGLRAGWNMKVLNPKRVGEFRWLDPDHKAGIVASEPAAMFDAVAAFHGEMFRRADWMEHMGVAKRLDLDRSTLEAAGMATRELLLVDELVSLLNMKGLVVIDDPSRRNAKLDRLIECMRQLQEITSMGRALGMSAVFMTQHPIAETMGPFGSTMKANLGARIGLGALEPEGAGSLFGKSNGEAIAAELRAGHPGRCVHQGLAHGDDGNWKVGQALWDRDRLLNLHTPHNGVPEGMPNPAKELS